MYAVVLSYDRRPHLRMIEQTHQFVLERLVSTLATLAPGLQRCGTSDLAMEGKKISGNSMRAGRTHLLYHGTLLYDFSLDLIETCLKTPPRQPEYREGRTHRDFVANLPVPVDVLRAAVTAAWSIAEAPITWPQQETRRLVLQRYGRDDWNFRR